MSIFRDSKEKRVNSENFNEANIESLKKSTLPEKAYRMFMTNHGAGEKVKTPSKEVLKKTAKMLLNE